MCLTRLTLEEVNNLSSNDFIQIFGNIIERCPIAAIKILKYRPFHTVQDLIKAFNGYLDTLNFKEKENILKYQIDVNTKIKQIKQNLYNKVSDKTMCMLDAWSYDIYLLNEEYKKKFAFPFVICTNYFSVISVLHAMECRMSNEKEEEVTEAFLQVRRIVSCKICNIITDR